MLKLITFEELTVYKLYLTSQLSLAGYTYYIIYNNFHCVYASNIPDDLTIKLQYKDYKNWIIQQRLNGVDQIVKLLTWIRQYNICSMSFNYNFGKLLWKYLK